MQRIYPRFAVRLQVAAAVTIGVFALPGINSTAWAANPRMDKQDFNSQLVEKIKGANKGGGQSEAALSELTAAAKQRKAEMLEKIEQDPSAFLQAVLPEAARRALPAEARAFIEKEIALEGELEVIQIDALDPDESVLQYFLNSADGSGKFRLHFASRSPLLKGGAKVKVKGVGLDQEVVLAAGGEDNLETVEEVEAAVSGNRTAIAMVIRFEDKDAGCSVSFVDDLLFGSGNSVDQYYREASFNNLSLTGRVHNEVITIPYSSTGSCDPYGWARAADEAAAAAHPDFNDFNHRVYVLPQNSCNYAGLGNVGGNPARAWVMGYCNISDIYAHEIGHNFGMHHAATPSNQYGDYSDIMGYSNVGLRHPNAPHKHEMGWVPESKVENVFQDGTYTVGVLESQSLLPQTLKLVKADTSDEYYVSYRVPTGFDSVLRSEYRYRANIHTWKGSGNKTYFHSVLDDGGEYVDDTNGFTIKQVRHDADSLTLQVSFSGAQCQENTPDMVLNPAAQSAEAGGEAVYTLTLYNNDSSACPPSEFTFEQLLPQGWGGIFSSGVVTLYPGENASTVWTVSVPHSENDGNYVLQIETVKSGQSGLSVSATTNFTVLSESLSPSVSITSPADGATVGRRENIIAEADDAGGIKEVRFFIDGVLVSRDRRAPYAYRWDTRKEVSGSHRIRVEAEANSGQSVADEITVWVK